MVLKWVCITLTGDILYIRTTYRFEATLMKLGKRQKSSIVKLRSLRCYVLNRLTKAPN